MCWESSPLAPRRCKWQVRLEWGPYTLEGETPGSVTLVIGLWGGTLLPIAWLRAMGARGGAAMAGHDGKDFFRARSDGYSLWEDGVIWICGSPSL